MTRRAPRTANEAIAGAFDVSPGYMRQYMKRLGGVTPTIAAFNARLKAEAAVADLEAWESINESDLNDAATSDNPKKELRSIVTQRADQTIRFQLAAHASWATEDDPVERTRPAREAFIARFERQVDPDQVLPLAERVRRAEHAKKAYFLGLAWKSAKARRTRKESSS